MLNPFASFGIYIAEMLIAYLYFSGFLEQRRPTWQCLLLGGLCFTGASALNLLLPGQAAPEGLLRADLRGARRHDRDGRRGLRRDRYRQRLSGL